MSDVVIRVENISKLYRLGEVGTGSLAHDVNRWWHRVRGKEDPYLKIGEVNDRTKPAKQASSKKSLTTEDTESTEGAAGVRLAGQAGAAFPNPSTSELASDSENTSLIRAANEPRFSGQRNGSGDDAESQKTENFNLKTENSAPKGSDWVYALKDVSFEVKRGEVLGIIGRNGAGKSTLLKILSRVTTQSSGQIKVRGRIASLLEVGTGFHPELTGRENIFLNGAILGMRKAEIARKFDEIVEFSGCARYIDTPVKRYSSGMYVRLAFAVAAHLEPEILIVDEVLAVGDAEFQKKCLGKMKDVAGHGRTILFVSHQIPSVTRLCNRVIWMEKGGVKKSGPALDICNDYLAAERPMLSTKTWTDESSFPGNSWVRLESVTARGGADDPTVFPISQPVELEIGYQVIKSGKVLIPNIHFYSSEGALIFVSHDWHSGWRDQPREVGLYSTTFTIPSNFFCEGTISVTAAISSYNPFELHACENEVVSFTMLDDLEDSDIRGDYTGRIPGLVRPLLTVETKFL